MTGDSPVCHKCGKKKRERLEGSFTQWIFDHDSCSCDLMPGTAREKERPVCRKCGKRVAVSKGGSMTQWIFKSDLCRCEHADLGWKFDADSRQSDPTDTGDEKELELDPSTFPVDRYKPLRELGSGASGTVYGCRDRLLGKRVAVKILRKLTAEQLVAFQNEARATSKLHHPAILQLLDFGPTDSGIPYMVLEYFNSITLGDYIESHGPLEVSQFLQIFLPIVAALDVAHTSGIFHRDLKPSNILISTTERTEYGAPAVKLIDFGVAQVKQDTYPSIVIQGKTIAGTPGYMSPDIVTGKAFDERSEVYSLGCVMFESLTGFNPFRAETAMESFALQSKIESPVLTDYSEHSFPEELEELVACCLAREPDSRFGSMREVENHLVGIEWERDETQTTPALAIEKGAKSGSGILALIAFGLVLVCGAMGVYFFNTLKDPPPAYKQRLNSRLVSFDKLGQVDENEETLLRTTGSIKGLLVAAESGDSNKQFELGRRYLQNGKFSDAQKWFTRASSGGSSNATLLLARMYECGHGAPIDSRKAFSLCSAAAKAGHAEAQDALACMYYRGFGTPVDYRQAFRWLSEAGKRNDRALTRAGVLYQKGRGVKQNVKRATSIFFETAERGCSLGQFCIGDAYEKGLGLQQSNKLAWQWFTVSTQSPRPLETAYMRMGRINLLGLGTQTDPGLAFWQFRKALGDRNAAFYIGTMYALGEGVPGSYKYAAVSFEELARKPEADAEICLAYLYSNGLGVERNNEKAKTWLEKAFRHSNGRFNRKTRLDNTFDFKKLQVEHDAFSLDVLFDVPNDWM